MTRIATSVFSFVFSILFLISACGGGGGSAGDDDATPDAPLPPDGMTSTLDPTDCTGVAASFATAAQSCGAPLPPGGQAQLETMCKKGVASAQLCGGNPAAGLACFETYDSTDWVCAAGEPYPACNGDLAASLGMYCLISLGNPSCASGIQCQFNSDCSNGLSCNGATKQCFSKSAYCVGLPCEFNADCPSGHTCNNAEGACIAE